VDNKNIGARPEGMKIERFKPVGVFAMLEAMENLPRFVSTRQMRNGGGKAQDGRR
jgi:hypothetical protein